MGDLGAAAEDGIAVLDLEVDVPRQRHDEPEREAVAATTAIRLQSAPQDQRDDEREECRQVDPEADRRTSCAQPSTKPSPTAASTLQRTWPTIRTRTSASVVRKRTSGCGCIMAAGLTTAGHAQKPARAQMRSHGLPGKTLSTMPSSNTALATVSTAERSCAGRSTSWRSSQSPKRRSSPAIAYHPGGVVGPRRPEPTQHRECPRLAGCARRRRSPRSPGRRARCGRGEPRTPPACRALRRGTTSNDRLMSS